MRARNASSCSELRSLRLKEGAKKKEKSVSLIHAARREPCERVIKRCS